MKNNLCVNSSWENTDIAWKLLAPKTNPSSSPCSLKLALSGKTLAFLIPLLEKLYRLRISPPDGPGAIVFSPTRELAVQIFEVLRTVGSHHDLSAGLLVGGKKEFGLEQARVGRTNVLIATPGRLLQHLEQTPNFDVSNVSILVLDEADRILDMGFREQMVRILDYLPPGKRNGGSRQTLLFSATQTRKVSDLAALSLDPRPIYVGVHDKTTSATPDGLKQGYVIVPLQHKLDAVFSFIKSHLKSKIIIFFASCSQVRYVWRVFCALQPGTPVMAIHGKVKQETRTKLYFDFLKRPSAVLLATDVAARGLDFPNVDWVIQADAPEDVDMYIHRVGRTARYNADGRSLLVLLPSETKMVKHLEGGKIPIKKLSINPTKTVQVSRKASALVASDPELNALAKKSFKSYIRSVSLMPDSAVFRASELQTDEFAQSLGLATTPSIRFLKKTGDRDNLREKKNVNRKLEKLKEQIRAERLKKRLDRMGGSDDATNTALDKGSSAKRGREKVNNAEDGDADDLLVVKKRHTWGDDCNQKINDDHVAEDLPTVDINQVTKSRHPKRIRIDGSALGMNKKIIFDDDGEENSTDEIEMTPVSGSERRGNVDVVNKSELASANEEYLQKVRERLEVTKDKDKIEERERIREKHRKRRMKDKGEREEVVDAVGYGAVLASSSDDSDASSVASEIERSASLDSSSDEESNSGAESDVDEQGLEEQALAMIRQKG